MLNKFKILFLFSFIGFLYSNPLKAQDYVLDFTDTSTYDVNCGKVVPSAWTVKLDSCELHTPSLETSNTSPSWMTYTVRINQSGNLNIEENAYIQHRINDSIWINDTILTGFGLDAVFSLTDSIFVNIDDHFQIRVIFETNDGTQFWQLKNGDIRVKNAVIHTNEGSLPVEYTYFNIQKENNLIKIRWATASETNNDYFIIERSKNAYTFDSISYTKGHGNSNFINEYEVTDFPDNNQILYYRIKQVDFDGKFKYSHIISLSDNTSKDMVHYISNHTEFYLTINSNNPSNISINIINAGTGQTTNNVSFPVNKGSTNISLNELINQPGIYCISSIIDKTRHSITIPIISK